MTDELLADLASLFSVQTSWSDVHGQEHQVAPDTLRAVLASLGVAAADPGDAIRAERLRRHRLVVEPVAALRGAGGQVVQVAVPRAVHPRDLWMTITMEDGRQGRTRVMPAIHRPIGTSVVEGVAVDRYEVRVSQTADGLPAGYHRLAMEGPGIDVHTLLVVAPRCPVPPRGWGAFLPVHALRTDDDWGVGNYPAFADLARFIDGLGGEMVATLPLYPGFYGAVGGLEAAGGAGAAGAALDDGDPAGAPPMDVSPYLPVSRLGWNELFVDPRLLPELQASAETQALLEAPDFVADMAAARRSARVDYHASASLVRRALEPLGRAVLSSPSARRDALAAFCSARPEMVSYARFRGGLDFVSADGLATTEPTPVNGADLYRLLGNDEARYHCYAQFVAAEQLAACGDRLLLDLAIGTHPDGFDTHFEPTVFAHGVQGGAPPDLFFDGGQRWGFRPLQPHALREQGYRHTVAIMRHVMQRAAVVRIDHVMGLYRLWWVPDGAAATDGAYVDYPAAELRAVACLEAYRSSTSIVGEDLGTVPDEVRTGMAEDRMLRSWVLEFEVHPDRAIPDAPELSLATVSTHDLDRFVTFFERPEQATWRRVMGGDARRALRVGLDQMASGPARSMLVDLEDLWLEPHPHNRPGTGPMAGNWQHRSTRTVEQIASDPAVLASLRRVDEARRTEEVVA